MPQQLTLQARRVKAGVGAEVMTRMEDDSSSGVG